MRTSGGILMRSDTAFRYKASVEELNMDPKRGTDKAQIADLITGGYIERGEPLLISGATGCGKSFLASALGLKACSQGKKVLYFNLQKLLQRTKIARLEGSMHKLLDRIAKLTC